MKTLLAALALVPLLAAAATTPAAGQAAPAPVGAAAQAEPAQVMVMLPLPAPHFRAEAAYGGSYTTDPGRRGRRKTAQDLAQEHGLKLVDDWPMPLLGIDCYVFTLPAGADPQRVAAALDADRRVEWAQPVASFRMLGGRDAGDPLYPVQPASTAWKLVDLHRAATGRHTVVAVVDSGVDASHPDLAGQVAHSQNFVAGQPYAAEAHGTAVAGIIAARAGNGVGIRGVAPDARLLALRACRERAGAAAQCDTFSLAKALNFAIQRSPNVINLSLSGPSDRLLQRLLDAAMSRSIQVVGAVDPAAADGGFPASWPGVLAVSDRSERRALAAPGADIPVLLPGGRFGVQTGSSYAAAHVSGLLALMGELRPGATITHPANATLDACEALSKVSASCLCSCPVTRVSTALRQP